MSYDIALVRRVTSFHENCTTTNGIIFSAGIANIIANDCVNRGFFFFFFFFLISFYYYLFEKIEFTPNGHILDGVLRWCSYHMTYMKPVESSFHESHMR